MRRLLIALVMLLTAPLATASDTLQHATILSPDGTLYTLESDFSFSYGIESRATRVLRLITQRDGEVHEEFVPASLRSGWHAAPSITYDEATQTLFAFWEHSESIVSSELLIATYRDGEWTEPVSINSAAFKLRRNFQIATTRWSEAYDDAGDAVRIPSLIVHAIYWETNGYDESARYAMISFRDGKVLDIQERSPVSWTLSKGDPVPHPLPSDYDREIFRHPSITAADDGSTVEVVFADFDRSRFHRVRILPKRGNGVLDVPDGIWLGEIGTPDREFAIAGASTSMIVEGSTVAFYSMNGEELRYQINRNGEWSSVRRIAATQSVTLDRALAALTRLVEGR